MKSRDWLELLMPTILVGLAWLVMSSVTTFYITWLDQRHQEVLNENVASIRAAAEMQHALWELQVLAIATPPTAPPVEAAPLAPAPVVAGQFRMALAEAGAAARTLDEFQVIEQIREKFERFVGELARSRIAPAVPMASDETAGMAVEIANLCDQLRVINQKLIEQRTAAHRRWSGLVIGVRMLVTMLGLLIGLWLGYRVASRLRRRLAAIHVTLEGATGELGQFVVEPSKSDGNLDAIDRQVREVAGRLQQALSDVEGARREATRNERLAAVGQLAAGIAHELRNPLTAVKLLVQTAAHKAPKDGRSQEPLAVVQDEIARMENTIQSLLDFARPSVSQRRGCDLRETLRRAVNLVQGRADQERIRIEVSDARVPLWVLCDPEQLHQVFVNLLLNGVDAMPQGGTLHVQLRRLPAGASEDFQCEVAVIDQGDGIPPQLLDHIFEPFVTTKARGTGLGLAISRRMVEEHGGCLSASNGPERGAVFRVRLPCCAAGEGVR